MTITSPELAVVCDLDRALWDLPRQAPVSDLLPHRREALGSALDSGSTVDEAADALHVASADVYRMLHPTSG